MEADLPLSPKRAAELLRRSLFRQRNKRLVNYSLRRLNKLGEEDLSIRSWVPILSSILLIESRERPRLIRGIEWIASILFRYREFTCGVFQMTNSPFRFTRAASEVVRRLELRECTSLIDSASLTQIARAWHGAASKQPGEMVGYQDALEIALENFGFPSFNSSEDF